MTKVYSTQKVADAVGISKRTLLQWLYDGKLREPRRFRFNGPNYRIWTGRDVERVRRYKAAHFRKGRGRKPKKKA